MAVNLTTESKKVAMVIEYNNSKGKPHKIDYDQLNMVGFDYFLILHDKDIDKNGVLKHKHYHLVISAMNKHRYSWYLNRVTEIFNCSPNAVQISSCDSLVGSVQYLIHKNNADKYQYDRYDIMTNVLSSHLEEMINEDISSEGLTFSKLQEIYDECNGNKLDIMKKIGLSTYNTFYRVITDFIREYAPTYKQKVYRYACNDTLSSLQKD